MKNTPDEEVKQSKGQPEKHSEIQSKEHPEKQTKEQAILLAAEQEFLSKGYDGARTTSIADAAGDRKSVV